MSLIDCKGKIVLQTNSPRFQGNVFLHQTNCPHCLDKLSVIDCKEKNGVMDKLSAFSGQNVQTSDKLSMLPGQNVRISDKLSMFDYKGKITFRIICPRSGQFVYHRTEHM